MIFRGFWAKFVAQWQCRLAQTAVSIWKENERWRVYIMIFRGFWAKFVAQWQCRLAQTAVSIWKENERWEAALWKP